MEPPSIYHKAPMPHDHDPSRSISVGHHCEESAQPKSSSPKPPPEGSREGKMETTKSPGRKITELLKGKEQEWTSVVRKAGPLRLLDLPLDILKDILREVTHTNDLASLALACSAMHAVVTPLIYNRFDIVWPDALNSSEPRSGVDALTFGLATLVMREDLFGNARLPQSDPNHTVCHSYSCTKCGMINHVSKASNPPVKRRLRRGNYFSHFTKKFSLGNGPADWVQEYLVTKESGKMLGTLVALSLARMPNLESFVWDMPTGILRDIWISLSSLGEYEPCKLSKVWVRFHDNKTALQEAGPQYPAPAVHTNVMIPHSTIPLASMPSYNKLEPTSHPTENPNFSTLPPLQSLTVLAIDELAYLEEISVLIGRSRGKLRELRIGLASKINTSGYDAYHPTVALFAAGTEMALLLNAIYDAYDPRSENYIYKPKATIIETPSPKIIGGSTTSPGGVASQSSTISKTLAPEPRSDEAIDDSKTVSDGTFGLSEPMSRVSFSPEIPLSYASIDPALPHVPHPAAEKVGASEGECGIVNCLAFESPYDPAAQNTQHSKDLLPMRPEDPKRSTSGSTLPTRQHTDPETEESNLKLETLELEGCLLNVFVLTQSIDFSILTGLTLLHCEAADILWSQLSRQFPSPALKQKSTVVTNLTQASSSAAGQKTLRRMSTMDALPKEPLYALNLKRVHTDTVSPSLITFLSKTLGPNSLEWLFLQDNPSSVSPVTIDAIYKGPLRRHRASLTKVMIDSSTGASGTRSRSTSALKWVLGRDFLTFVTSGKMNRLRELAMVIEYKDWHFFLQRLPNIPHLRSLYVPHIANHVYGSGLNVRELAMGVVDVVTLRSEIELCYLGISTKCFEILERKQKAKRKESPRSGSLPSQETDDDDDDDDDDEDYHYSEEDDENEDGGEPTPATTSSPSAIADDGDADDEVSSSEDEIEIPAVKKLKYKLREILFYDDKISIFKARHGRL